MTEQTITLPFSFGENVWSVGKILKSHGRCEACKQIKPNREYEWAITFGQIMSAVVSNDGPIWTLDHGSTQWGTMYVFATAAEARAECDRRNGK